MIQLSSMMWAAAIFFAIVGFLRGWNREVISTAGIVLAMFSLFQFDNILRGTVFLWISRDQIFLLQAAIFSVIVFLTYQSRGVVSASERRGAQNWQTNFLGGIVGFLNGYLISGALWYFLDINEYPLYPYVLAPSPTSPSAQAIGSMPLVMLSGGVNGTGDLLTVIVIGLFFVVIAVAV